MFNLGPDDLILHMSISEELVMLRVEIEQGTEWTDDPG